MTASSRSVGSLGEELALEFLVSKGYTLRHRNFKSRFGEIDLIMTHPEGDLIFIEVKHYLGTHLLHPLEQISLQKHKLLKTAKHYLHTFHLYDTQCQFDAIVISDPIEHIENIFT